MNILLKRAVLLVLPFIVLYLMIAFITNDFNCSNWDLVDRGLVGIGGVLLGVVIASIPEEFIN